MEEKQVNFDLDKYLLTANLSIIVGYFLIFQITPKNIYIQYSLIFAFTSLLVSFALFVWSNYRLPIRKKYFSKLQSELSEKYSTKIADFLENVVKPLTRLETGIEALQKLLNAPNKKEADIELQKIKDDSSHKDKDKTRYYDVIQTFITLMSIESKENHENAFKKPLKESRSSIKYIFDKISFNYRYHCFTVGLAATLIAVILHLMS